MTDWARVREDFPITRKCAYFMSAAMSPLPRPVFDRISGEYRKLLEDGDVFWNEDMETYRDLCADLAGLIAAGPGDVTFGPNTSTLMGLVGLSLQKHAPPGFHVVTLRDEFPASTVPLEHLGIPLRLAEPVAGRYSTSAVLDLVDDRTAAVVSSYVQYATGFRLDLAPLGRELARRGVLFVVNATQGFPYYPLDVRGMGIDVLTASLHKWGMSGHVGALFFTAPSFREKYPPALAGWLSVDTDERGGVHTGKNVPFRLHDSARRYEFGTFNIQPLLGLRESLNYLKAIGFEAIRERLAALSGLLLHGLKRLGVPTATPADRPEERSSIVAFTLGERNDLCYRKLGEERIYVSPRAGLLRVAVNIFNDEGEIARLLDVVKSVQEGR